jgi:hypothetical protein
MCCHHYSTVSKPNISVVSSRMIALETKLASVLLDKTTNNSRLMLLEKTLHMSQPVAECKARLASIQSYRRQFLMVTRATVTSSKTVDFSFRGPFGFEAHTVLLSVDGDSPDQYAFESAGGNISLMGIVDFAEIRPNCTEVTLAVHYEIKNRFFAWLDRRLHFVDGFVTAELRSIRAHFEGIRSSYLERPRVMPVLQAAHA